MILLFLFAAGSTVGFLSGLLGIGGGILMFPALLYGPRLLGLEVISVKSITGLTMIQGFFASLSAMLFYRTAGYVSSRLVLTVGVTMFLSSLAGALLTGFVSESAILVLFGFLAVIAAVLMILPRSYANDDVPAQDVSFNQPMAVIISLTLGVILGLLGQGGAFILIPVLLYVLKIPLRVAIGSMLAIGLFSSGAGLAGKITTGHVPFLMAAVMVAGAVPAALLGGVVGKRTDKRFLRWLLAAIIAFSAARIWLDIL